MPWEKGITNQGGLKGRERSARRLTPSSPGSLAAFQAAWRIGLFTQGIGLRPQTWAMFSRPVGPVLIGALRVAQAFMPERHLTSSPARGATRADRPRQGPDVRCHTH